MCARNFNTKMEWVKLIAACIDKLKAVKTTTNKKQKIMDQKVKSEFCWCVCVLTKKQKKKKRTRCQRAPQTLKEFEADPPRSPPRSAKKKKKSNLKEKRPEPNLDRDRDDTSRKEV